MHFAALFRFSLAHFAHLWPPSRGGHRPQTPDHTGGWSASGTSRHDGLPLQLQRPLDGMFSASCGASSASNLVCCARWRA